jgi:hypothetical protein
MVETRDSGEEVVGEERRAGPAFEREKMAEPSSRRTFASDGVDLTLIRWMLERSPTERLRAAQSLIDAAWALRSGREA